MGRIWLSAPDVRFCDVWFGGRCSHFSVSVARRWPCGLGETTCTRSGDGACSGRLFGRRQSALSVAREQGGLCGPGETAQWQVVVDARRDVEVLGAGDWCSCGLPIVFSINSDAFVEVDAAVSTGGRYGPGEPGHIPGGSGADTRQPRLPPSKRTRRIVNERTFAMSDVAAMNRPFGLRPAPLSPRVLAQRNSSSRGQCGKTPDVLLHEPSIVVRSVLRGAPRRRHHAGRGAGVRVLRAVAFVFRTTVLRYRYTIVVISSSSIGARQLACGVMDWLAGDMIFSRHQLAKRLHKKLASVLSSIRVQICINFVTLPVAATATYSPVLEEGIDTRQALPIAGSRGGPARELHRVTEKGPAKDNDTLNLRHGHLPGLANDYHTGGAI